jgi:hypothetical protein
VAAAGAAAASPGSFFAGVFQGLVGGLAPPQAAATQQLGTFMITPVVPPVCGAMPPVTEKGTGPLNGFLLTANGTLVGKNMSMIFQASVTKEQAKAMVFFNPNPGGRNFFDAFCNFTAAVGDRVSGGLTKRFRDGAGYGDAVNTNSDAYAAGAVVGDVLNVGLSMNPCGLAGTMRTLFNGIQVGQVVGGTLNGIDNWRAGNYFSAGLDFLGAGASFGSLFRACFTGEMLLDTEHGKKRADAIQVGDKLWSRNEFDPDGPIELKEVEEVFIRVAPIMNLHVAGQIIRTTREHPFYVEGRGWIAAAFLEIGDRLSTRDGTVVAVEGVANSGQVKTVYNWRIAEYHTYFVGADRSGFGVWAHNASYSVTEAIERGVLSVRRVVGASVHHIASVTSRLTPQFRELFARAGLSLESAWNRTRVLGHVGPHGWYNAYILSRLRRAVRGLEGAAYRSALLDELWELRREIQNGTLGDLLRAAGRW